MAPTMDPQVRKSPKEHMEAIRAFREVLR